MAHLGGLLPKGGWGAIPHSGGVQRFYIPSTDSTAAYIGGLAKLAGSSDATGKFATVTANVSAADVVVGAIGGVAAIQPGDRDTDPRAALTYRAASTNRYVDVVVDPRQVYEIDEDGDTTPIAAASVGLNATLINLTSGSTVDGRSSMQIDSSTVATTATLDVQILNLTRKVGNAIGAAGSTWDVRLNNHQFVDGATGV